MSEVERQGARVGGAGGPEDGPLWIERETFLPPRPGDLRGFHHAVSGVHDRFAGRGAAGHRAGRAAERAGQRGESRCAAGLRGARDQQRRRLHAGRPDPAHRRGRQAEAGGPRQAGRGVGEGTVPGHHAGPELEAFLDGGEPPIYFGLGSVRGAQDTAANAVKAARALGKRVVLQRGWADLQLTDDAGDCIAIGEVNQQALFRRVAAIVHHGGAGTTTTAAAAGTPQIVLPHMYDQYYWGNQIERLNVGRSAKSVTTETLDETLQLSE
ncbi:hypothetical protein FXN61_14985 [Lentzea sp. PSKA42]|uniref:Erythromycin biosynthesis protein CIII-like C-terminal domain-containing protein n=1 Tax=Lentzea indica TaxID=2604800 RepID=A0ABX1FH59_9PSEU|nr:hypothetical protein [Lentzea indica]